jgi:K+-transporting ATPase c subunit
MIGHDSVFGGTAALDGNISLTDAIVQLPGVARWSDIHLRTDNRNYLNRRRQCLGREPGEKTAT